MRVRWIPAAGTPVPFTTGPAAPYRLLALDGIGPVAVEPQTIKSPGQAGATAVDILVPPRVVVLQALLQAADNAALWALRSAVSRAMVAQPVRHGEAQETGRLVFERDGMAAVEIEAIPRSASVPAPRGGVGVLPIDLEWLCPYPYWRDEEDVAVALEGEGGFEFSLEFSLEMTSNNVQQEIVNAGDVDAPIVARIYGDCTDASLINDTTGETLTVVDQIEADQYVEISTAFGDKRVELVDGGVRTSIMDRVDLSGGDDFWSLRPGANTVRFDAGVNVSGRATVAWRQRYGGI